MTATRGRAGERAERDKQAQREQREWSLSNSNGRALSPALNTRFFFFLFALRRLENAPLYSPWRATMVRNQGRPSPRARVCVCEACPPPPRSLNFLPSRVKQSAK